MSDKPAYLGMLHQDGEGPHEGTVEVYESKSALKYCYACCATLLEGESVWCEECRKDPYQMSTARRDS